MLLDALSIIAMIATACATLTAIVFCLGMGANASPAQLRALKLWSVAFGLLGLAGIAAGIYLLRAGQSGWATGVSILPAAVMAVVFAFALRE